MGPGSAESLVAAVERLADDRAFAVQRGGAAREFVARRYNRDVLADRFLRLLEGLTGGHVDQSIPVTPEAERDDAWTEPRLVEEVSASRNG